MRKLFLLRLKKSPIGHKFWKRRTLQALGLRRVNQEVLKPCNPQVEGMIAKVQDLLEVRIVENEGGELNADS
ncbi:50S ribosomal protein L30 [bacterium]|nr:50S ribosomal protein L30 [bacterium]